MPSGKVLIPATLLLIFCPRSIPPPPGFAPCPTTISIASAFLKSSGFIPYREGNNWYTRYLEDPLSSFVMPPSPVVVEVPIAEAPLPKASFALAPKAPKLIPAIVIGISNLIGFFAKRSPSITEVLHFSL